MIVFAARPLLAALATRSVPPASLASPVRCASKVIAVSAEALER